MIEVEYLTVGDLLLAAKYACRPAQPLLRDPGALAAAAGRPATTVFGQDAYPMLADKAAALLHSIVRNQPLVDSDRRLGWLALVGFLRRNGHELHIVDAALAEAFVLGVAEGELDVDEAAKFVALHMRQS